MDGYVGEDCVSGTVCQQDDSRYLKAECRSKGMSVFDTCCLCFSWCDPEEEAGGEADEECIRGRRRSHWKDMEEATEQHKMYDTEADAEDGTEDDADEDTEVDAKDWILEDTETLYFVCRWPVAKKSSTGWVGPGNL